MAFDFADVKETFRWRVEVTIPNDKGRHDTFAFMAEFNNLPIDETRAILDDDDYEDRNLADAVLCGWDDSLKLNGEPMDYTDENRQRIINYTPASSGIVRAFLEAISGESARRKNSSKRRSTG